MRQIFLVLSVLALSAGGPALAKPQVEPSTDQALARFVDGFLTREVKRREIPGAAIVLVRNGRPILSSSYGVSDLSTRKPIDPNTSLFRQGSIAKLFTWTLAMQLVEQGRLDLDRDINSYLDFAVPQAFGKPITMRHLLTHTGGFAERMPLARRETERLSMGRKLQQNMPDRVYAPGSTLAYSNYGAALGAYIVERIAGVPFDQLARERIFEPAGMISSTFAQPVPGDLRPRLVSNYSASARSPGRFERISFPATGSLSATPADMGRLVATFLAGGQGPHGRVLSPSAVDAMIRLQQPLVPGMSAGLGLGFIVGEYRGVAYAGHGGSMDAAATDLELLPEHGVGWTLSFNGRGYNGSAIPLRQELLRAVIDRFYAGRRILPPAGAASTAEDVAGSYVPARRPHSGPQQLLLGLSAVDVEAAPGGGLQIELEGTQTRWLPNGRDAFVEAATGLPLRVERNSSGRIVSLASPLLNSVTEYEPAPLHVRAALPILLVVAPFLLFRCLVVSLAGLWRRRRNSRSAEVNAQAKQSRLRCFAGPSLTIVFATLVGWIAYFVVPMAMPRAHGTAATLLPLLELFSLLCCIAALILIADAINRWLGSQRRVLNATAATLIAVASASFAWLLASFGLVGLPIPA